MPYVVLAVVFIALLNGLGLLPRQVSSGTVSFLDQITSETESKIGSRNDAPQIRFKPRPQSYDLGEARF